MGHAGLRAVVRRRTAHQSSSSPATFTFNRAASYPRPERSSGLTGSHFAKLYVPNEHILAVVTHAEYDEGKWKDE